MAGELKPGRRALVRRTMADGTVYEGLWRDGDRDGQGMLRRPSLALTLALALALALTAAQA